MLHELRAYAHDDFPEHPLAAGCNWLQRQQIISVGLQKYPETWLASRAYSRDDLPERALSSFVNQISGRGDRRFSAASERARRIS